MKKSVLMAIAICLLSVFAQAQTYQLKYPKIQLKADTVKVQGNLNVVGGQSVSGNFNLQILRPASAVFTDSSRNFVSALGDSTTFIRGDGSLAKISSLKPAPSGNYVSKTVMDTISAGKVFTPTGWMYFTDGNPYTNGMSSSLDYSQLQTQYANPTKQLTSSLTAQYGLNQAYYVNKNNVVEHTYLFNAIGNKISMSGFGIGVNQNTFSIKNDTIGNITFSNVEKISTVDSVLKPIKFVSGLQSTVAPLAPQDVVRKMDIDSLQGFNVKTNAVNQEVDGSKTFKNTLNIGTMAGGRGGLQFQKGIQLRVNPATPELNEVFVQVGETRGSVGTAYRYSGISVSDGMSSRDFTFPGRSGFFALLSDFEPFQTKIDSLKASAIANQNRIINTGFGLAGGGNLTADRTLTADTTVLKSKAGALIDYNILKNKLNLNTVQIELIKATNFNRGLGLLGGGSINSTEGGDIFYRADTTVLKSKAGALIDYNILKGAIGTIRNQNFTSAFGISGGGSINGTEGGDIVFGADTTVLKSKAGALIDYNILKGAVTAISAGTFTGSATLDFPATAAYTSSDLQFTLAGVNLGDIIVLGTPVNPSLPNSCFTAIVSATNQVNIRFNNYSSVSANPPSGIFKVKVFK